MLSGNIKNRAKRFDTSFWCLKNSPFAVHDGGREAAASAEIMLLNIHTITHSGIFLLAVYSQVGCSETKAASLYPKYIWVICQTGLSAMPSTGCQLLCLPYLDSNQLGFLVSTCSTPGTFTQPERVNMSLTIRISSIRLDLTAKRRV